MRIEQLLKKLTRTRKAIWSDLMNHIDSENWSTLKRMHNRLTDDIEKLRNMKMHIEEMDSMRLHHKEALKVLAKVKKDRKGRKFQLIKVDARTWKETEVKS